MVEIADVPPVVLDGSEEYWSAYEWGDKLEAAFPGQDASDFASACNYNDWGPLLNSELTVTSFIMGQQGENDGGEWIWFVWLSDGSRWQARGGCDYTGWDCQSSLEWRQLSPPLFSVTSQSAGEEFWVASPAFIAEAELADAFPWFLVGWADTSDEKKEAWRKTVNEKTLRVLEQI